MRIFSVYGTLIICMLLPEVTCAQETPGSPEDALENKNAVDVTFGGLGLVLSINYNRFVTVGPDFFINASLGAGTVPLSGGLTVPHHVSVNIGRKSSFLELGAGGSFWTGITSRSGYPESIYSYQFSPMIGYRKHFPFNLVMRIYANLLVHISGEYYLNDKSLIPYAGVSLGHAF